MTNTPVVILENLIFINFAARKIIKKFDKRTDSDLTSTYWKEISEREFSRASPEIEKMIRQV